VFLDKTFAHIATSPRRHLDGRWFLEACGLSISSSKHARSKWNATTLALPKNKEGQGESTPNVSAVPQWISAYSLWRSVLCVMMILVE
jgi:hypothetical protein